MPRGSYHTIQRLNVLITFVMQASLDFTRSPARRTGYRDILRKLAQAGVVIKQLRHQVYEAISPKLDESIRLSTMHESHHTPGSARPWTRKIDRRYSFERLRHTTKPWCPKFSTNFPHLLLRPNQSASDTCCASLSHLTSLQVAAHVKTDNAAIGPGSKR